MHSNKTDYIQLFSNFLTHKKRYKTPERFAILRAVLHFNRPFSIAEIKDYLSKKKYAISNASLYNNFTLLEEARIISKTIDNDKIKYVIISITDETDGEISLYRPYYYDTIGVVSEHLFKHNAPPFELENSLELYLSATTSYKAHTFPTVIEAYSQLFHSLELTHTDEVILPANASPELATALLRYRVKLVWVDVTEEGNIDLTMVRECISSSTKIIISSFSSSSQYYQSLSELLDTLTAPSQGTQPPFIVTPTATPFHFIDFAQLPIGLCSISHYIISPLHFDSSGCSEIGGCLLVAPFASFLSRASTSSSLPELYRQLTSYEITHKALIVDKLQQVSSLYATILHGAHGWILPTAAISPFFSFYPIQIPGLTIEQRDTLIAELQQRNIGARTLDTPLPSYLDEFCMSHYHHCCRQHTETIGLPYHCFIKEGDIQKMERVILEVLHCKIS